MIVILFIFQHILVLVRTASLSRFKNKTVHTPANQTFPYRKSCICNAYCVDLITLSRYTKSALTYFCYITVKYSTLSNVFVRIVLIYLLFVYLIYYFLFVCLFSCVCDCVSVCLFYFEWGNVM